MDEADAWAAYAQQHPNDDPAPWIREVDERRRFDNDLDDGDWHGYLNAGGGGVLSGHYVLARRKTPHVAVCHDDKEQVFELAGVIEDALQHAVLGVERAVRDLTSDAS